MTIETLSFYSKVTPLEGVKTSHVVPSNGQTWLIYRFVGSASYDSNSRVCLIWDYGGANEVIRSTHGDMDMRISHEVVGDGSKKLAIVLTNESLADKTMGGSFEARVK